MTLEFSKSRIVKLKGSVRDVREIFNMQPSYVPAFYEGDKRIGVIYSVERHPKRVYIKLSELYDTV